MGRGGGEGEFPRAVGLLRRGHADPDATASRHPTPPPGAVPFSQVPITRTHFAIDILAG